MPKMSCCRKSSSCACREAQLSQVCVIAGMVSEQTSEMAKARNAGQVFSL